MGAEWDVRTCGFGEAVELVTIHHYAGGAANTAVYRHGLYRAADGCLGAPVGATMWMPPTKAAAVATIVPGEDWRGVLALSRLVVAPDCPTNAASFLLGRSMRLIDRERWPVFVTYADKRMGHTGAIYKATNWQTMGETAAGEMWLGPDGVQRGRKRGGRNMSRAEMLEAGFRPAPAANKIKFVHRLAS